LGGNLLRGAIFGAGSIAPYHLRAWSRIPEVRIVALANRTREKASRLGREFGIDEAHIYADYRDLLAYEKLDFVDITTAPSVHYEQVLAAARCGIHILCQKPLTTSLQEARALIVACEQAGVRLVVHENWRWRPWYRQLKQWLEAGMIGRPRYAAVRVHTDALLPHEAAVPELLVRQPYLRYLERLLLLDWGIHFFDIIRFLFGRIIRVAAHLQRLSPFVCGEDRAIVLLECAGGVIGILDLSWSSVISPTRRLERGGLEPCCIEGEQGTIELDPYRSGKIIVTTRLDSKEYAALAGLSPLEAYQLSFERCQRHFIECLRSGRPAENEARDNLEVLAAVFAAYASAERGCPVYVSEVLNM